MSDNLQCKYCDKTLSEEKGELSHGCLDCHCDPRVDKIQKLQHENSLLKQAVEKLEKCRKYCEENFYQYGDVLELTQETGKEVEEIMKGIK